MVRGRQVRKQAAVTLRCMQALVRVQARVRARRVRMSLEGQAVQKAIDEHRGTIDCLKEAEEGWCNSKGTLEEVKAKIQMRQEGAFKRDRALVYSLVHKERLNQSSDSQKSANSVGSLKNYNLDQNNWSWLERWMAARPWENRLMEQKTPSDPAAAETTPNSKTCLSDSSAKDKNHSDVRIRKNNVTKRVSAKLPSHPTRSSSSPSSDLRYDERSSASSSFCCTSTTQISGNSSVEKKNGNHMPNYMNLTQSTKAKQRNSRFLRQSMDEAQFRNLHKSGDFSNLGF